MMHFARFRMCLLMLSEKFPCCGIGWKSHLVEEYLQEVLVLKLDKDGGNVLMLVQAYLFEVNRHLSCSTVNN